MDDVKEAHDELEAWISKQLATDESKASKPKAHFFSQAAPKALLQLLQLKDSRLTDSLLTALTLCLESSTHAERLETEIDDYTAEPDIIGKRALRQHTQCAHTIWLQSMYKHSFTEDTLTYHQWCAV